MLAKWEPFSPQRLIDKTHKMHSPDSHNGLTHAPAYHKMSSGEIGSNKRNSSFINPPEIIAEEK